MPVPHIAGHTPLRKHGSEYAKPVPRSLSSDTLQNLVQEAASSVQIVRGTGFVAFEFAVYAMAVPRIAQQEARHTLGQTRASHSGTPSVSV